MLTFGGVTLYTVWEVHELGNTLTRLHTSLVPLPPMVAEMKSDLRRIRLVASLTEPESLRRASNHVRKVDGTPVRFAAMIQKVGRRLDRRQGSDIADGLQMRYAALHDAASAMQTQLDRFFHTIDSGKPIESQRRPTREAMTRLTRSLDLFGIEVDRALDRTINVFEADEDRVAWGAILLAAVAMLVGLIITFSANRLLSPLRELRAGVDRIARREYGQPVYTNDQGELGALATEFNRMAEAIQRRDEQLGQQQKQLLHREQLATVGRMSAQITHELRNPLSSIGLNSELLMEELEIDSENERLSTARELLVNIIKEVERLKEITEEYLRFARLPVPERAFVDLNHTAAELLEFVRSEMELAGVKTRLDADPASRPAFADPNQVRAALLNLLRNAREAMGEHGGHVVMRVRSLGDTVTTEVTDTGPGIPEGVSDQLFDPFFSTKPQGTGLGLSMVKQIAEAHGGSVTIERGEASGTTVRLSFPISEPALAPEDDEDEVSE